MDDNLSAQLLLIFRTKKHLNMRQIWPLSIHVYRMIKIVFQQQYYQYDDINR